MSDSRIVGNTPVQGYGEHRGHPWYFRARYDHWQFGMSEQPDGDFLAPPEWARKFVESMGGPFGDIPTDLDLLAEAERQRDDLADALRTIRALLTSNTSLEMSIRSIADFALSHLDTK